MKKLFAIIFSALLVCSFAACGQNSSSQTSTEAAATTAAQDATAAESGSEVIAGGYTDAASPEVPDSVKSVFAKATETLTGVGYEPVAYLGSQVVAGTNHLILCKATPTTAEPKSTYALVTLFEGLNGEAEITNVIESSVNAAGAADGETTGAYTAPEKPGVTDEAKAALEKALNGTQVVSGTNYMLLCKITTVTAEPVSHYSIVTVYEDLEGNASISETHDFSAEDETADADAASAQDTQAETSNG